MPLGRPRYAASPRAAHRSANRDTAIRDLINALVQAMSAATARPTKSRVSSAATPDRCKLEMSAGEFKAWRCSIEWWIRLNKLPAGEAVGHVRLFCSTALQRAMDSRFTVAEWSAFSVNEALDAIRNIVLLPTNKAAAWNKFFSSSQNPNEQVNTFFTRAAQITADCQFTCPNCSHDLGNYLLLGRLITGLCDSCLRKEVYRACDTFTINSLRSFCTAYYSSTSPDHPQNNYDSVSVAAASSPAGAEATPPSDTE